MTAAQTAHLIEQFAAQAPFALWITDSRGITIFANRKIHELLGIPEHPSGALGVNLFDDPSVAALRLKDIAARARAGEIIDTFIDIEHPDRLKSQLEITRTNPLAIRLICYALRSTAQEIEHYVIIVNDVTDSRHQRAELEAQVRDLAIYNRSKEGRLERLQELKAEISALEKEIRAQGIEPEA